MTGRLLTVEGEVYSGYACWITIIGCCTTGTRVQSLVRALQSVLQPLQSAGTRVQRLVRALRSLVRLVGSLPRAVRSGGTPVERLVRLLQVLVRVLDRIYRLLDVCHGLLDR